MSLAGRDLVRSDPGEIQLDTSCSFVHKLKHTPLHSNTHTHKYAHINWSLLKPVGTKAFTALHTHTQIQTDTTAKHLFAFSLSSLKVIEKKTEYFHTDVPMLSITCKHTLCMHTLET